MSTGYSAVLTWGEPGDSQVSFGTDLRHVDQELNDIEIFRPADSSNFPIPPSYAVNPGILFEYTVPSDSGLTIRTGGRMD